MCRNGGNWAGGRPQITLVGPAGYKYTSPEAWVRLNNFAEVGPGSHDLKNTFGTWLLQENSRRARTLAELWEHSDFSPTVKYALSDERRSREGS